MLKIQDVHKTFNPGTINEKKALNGVNLVLNEGDFVTVIGGNGAGKSTVLNMIAGVYPVDSGSIMVDDIDVTKLPEHKRAKYLGRVFQDPMNGTAADMNNEEIECAKILDCNDNVEFWVRNLERNPEYAFWLQTSTDKFYPDFIAKLIDGRIVAIEYKGANLITNDDSKEKAAVGHLWANLNKEKYAFAMVEKCTIDGVPLDRQLQQIIG